MKLKISAIPALGDNYIWCLTSKDSQCAVIFDPGKAQPVLDFLTARNLQLKCICITHHHTDHTGGINDLKKKFSVPVYGPAGERIPGVTERLEHKSAFTIPALELSLRALETPGHTKGHMVYLMQIDGTPLLFSGDTLFSSGCGRVFEGTYEQMYRSLVMLKSLPKNTLIYSAHEYTLDNLQFAQAVEPDNHKLKMYTKRIKQLREQGLPSIPTTLEDEWEYNPFLRCHREETITAAAQHTGKIPETEVDVFTLLRKWKNKF